MGTGISDFSIILGVVKQKAFHLSARVSKHSDVCLLFITGIITLTSQSRLSMFIVWCAGGSRYLIWTEFSSIVFSDDLKQTWSAELQSQNHICDNMHITDFFLWNILMHCWLIYPIRHWTVLSWHIIPMIFTCIF